MLIRIAATRNGVTAKKNPLLRLQRLGQSIWLNSFRRGMLTSGELGHLIRNDGLSGVTSNPATFEKAITESGDYNHAIRVLARSGKSAAEIYENLVVEDIRSAADIFRPLYERLEGRDGYASLAVSPYLAHDSAATILEARRLWERVDRPNVMIKVPGTWEGLPAIRQLISEGININVTLLFGIYRYRAVAEAFIDGLEERAAWGLPLERVASVASFSLNSLDALIDRHLQKVSAWSHQLAGIADSLHSATAIASAQMAYRTWQEIFDGKRYQCLVARNARPQRLLFAEAGTPAGFDRKYLDPLAGLETVNSISLETLCAYRKQGTPPSRPGDAEVDPSGTLKLLAKVGINLNALTQQLEEEGIEMLVKSYDRLMAILEQKRVAAQAIWTPQRLRRAGLI